MLVISSASSPALPISAAGAVSAGAVLTVDLAALRANYRRLCRQAGGARVAGVVKADAYGLGAERVAPVLWAEGCRTFFVAHLSEALALRPVLPDEAEILVLNGLAPGDERRCADAGIAPVINSAAQLDAWSALARALGRPLPAALQVDSGMARLGLAPEEVAAIAADPARLDGIDVTLVMSHLACADEPNHPANRAQLEAFRVLAAQLPEARRSLANSAGVFLGPDFHFDLCRPGIALYGGQPFEGPENPMRAVARLDARVIQIREVPAGAGVGYGWSLVTPGAMRLATIGIGYADGWPRALSNRLGAYHEGQALGAAGRVSMDSVILDIGSAALKPGDLVELIGPHQSLGEVAATAGTIPYEILTALGQRFERRYVEGALA